MNAAAFFDMDGTLIRSTIVHYYALIQTAERSPLGRIAWTLRFLPQIPWLLALDRVDRARMNRFFYRNYRGIAVERARRIVAGTWESFTVPRLFPEALRRLDWHRERGHRRVLVTGAARFLAEVVQERLCLDGVLATQLETDGKRFTGRILGPPLSGAVKAQQIRAYAEQHGIDLEASWAYGDSTADLPMLEAVGHPTVVNPSRRLRQIAQKRGWPCERWKTR